MRATEFVTERKKKKRKNRYFGGYWYPGFGYYGGGYSGSGDGNGGGDGGGGESVTEQSNPAIVTRIDSNLIRNFSSNLKSYKHTDDWSQSGLDTGDDAYWEKRKIKPKTSKGLYAGDPHRTALYATGNANETRFVEFEQDGQPVVYFDKKDLPAIRKRKTYLTVFDASNFKKLPTGEYFSKNPGEPIKQVEIGDPFQYIANQGWVVRITDNLDKIFKQAQAMHETGKIAHYGAEGMDESKENVEEAVIGPDDLVDVYIRGQHRGETVTRLVARAFPNKNIPLLIRKLETKHGVNPEAVVYGPSQIQNENFADGKVKGKSRPGRVKRSGASCAGSVSELRVRAKKYGGERGRMYHWCANMKGGRRK
jgi:hypothetical protein